MNTSALIAQHLLSSLLDRGRITRSELIHSGGFRPAAVLDVVNELKAKGIIEEPSRETLRTGRRSPELVWNRDFASFIGLEIAPGAVRMTVIDAVGDVKTRSKCELPPNCDVRTAWHSAENLASRVRSKVAGAGFADPGVVDVPNCRSLRAVNFAGWENLDLAPAIRRATGVTECLAVGECAARAFLYWSNQKTGDRRSLFNLHLDSGVGAAFIDHGTVFTGDNFRAMEVGHLVMDPAGPLCNCGGRGCLEAWAGEANIRRGILNLLDNHVSTCLKRDDVSLDAFIEAVRAHDRAAELFAASLCRKIAPIFPIVATLLNPGRVIISGRFAGVGNILLEEAERFVHARCLSGSTEKLTIEAVPFDEFAPSFGAARLIRDRILRRAELA